MQRGIFISDLHLFSRRSVGQQRWADLHTDLSQAHWLVLGGDIFDFRWSRHRHLEASLEAASDWLRKALRRYPQLEIVYVQGNHDCLLPMQDVLRRCALDCARFRWAEFLFRLGDKTFLHGDIVDAGEDLFRLQQYRRQFSREEKARGSFANLLYDAAVATRIHSLPGQWYHHPDRVASRISRYLSHESLSAQNGIRQVFFGHTHAPLRHFQYQHQEFFNAGSGIRHLPFRPCHFDITNHDGEPCLT